jgi:hypothetical protein
VLFKQKSVTTKKKKSILLRIFSILFTIVAGVVALLVVIALLLNIPAIQTFVTGLVTDSLQKKLNTEIRVGEVKIKLPVTVHLGEVYVEDQQQDTLLYVSSIDVNVNLLKLISQQVMVQRVEIDHLTTRIKRGSPEAPFNFDFILEAFAGDTTTQTDTTSSAWAIGINKIALSQIDALYTDSTTGMDTRLQLGKLDLNFDDFNLDKPTFGVDGLSLQNTTASLVQWDVAGAPVEAPAIGDTAVKVSNSFPEISLKLLALDSILLHYQNRSSGMVADLNLGKLRFEPEKIDLANQILELGTLKISNSKGSLAVGGAAVGGGLVPPQEGVGTRPTPTDDFFSNIFPDWNIKMQLLLLDDLDISYNVRNAPSVPFGLDMNHLELADLTLDLRDVTIDQTNVAAQLREMRGTANNELLLKNLSFDASLTQNEAQINNLSVAVNQTKINGSIHTSFTSLAQITENPGATQIDLSLKNCSLYTPDVYYLAGLNPRDSLWRKYNFLNVQVAAAAEGTIDDLNIRKLMISTLHTTLLASGEVANITHPEQLAFDARLDTLRTSRRDLQCLLDTTYFSGFILPDTIGIALHTKGSLDSLQAKLRFSSNFGKLSADGFFDRRGELQRDTVAVKLILNNFAINQWLNDTTMGEANLEATVHANGITADSLLAVAEATILDLQYHSYTYRDIGLQATMNGDMAQAHITSDDINVNFTIEAMAYLRPEITTVQADINVGLLNFHALNFSDSKFAMTSNIHINGQFGGIDDLKAEIVLKNTQIINEGSSYTINHIGLHPVFTPDSTCLDINSDFLKLRYESNIALSETDSLLRLAVMKYIGKADTLSLPADKHAELDLSIRLPEDLKGRLFPSLNKLELDTITGRYSSNSNLLELRVNAPRITYQKLGVDNLFVNVGGRNDSLSVRAGFDELQYDTLRLRQVIIDEFVRDGILISKISVAGTGASPDFLFDNNISVKDSTTHISFNKDGLVLKGEKWEVKEGNYLQWNHAGIIAQDFIFDNGDQKIGFITTDTSSIFEASNFELNNIFSIVHRSNEAPIIKGKMDAEVIIPVHEKYSGISADIAISNLHFLDTLIGSLQFHLKEATDALALQFELANGSNSITANGTIGKSDSLQPLDITTNIDLNDLSRLEVFTLGKLKDVQGSMKGDLTIKGNVQVPEVVGNLAFVDAEMTIAPLNFRARLGNETIAIDNRGVSLDNFTVEDPDGNKLIVDGRLLTEDLSNVGFDFNIKANDFKPINSTRDNNKTYYGSLVFDTDVDIKGDALLPVIKADITVKGGSDFTYVLPGSQVELVTTDGIINFTGNLQPADTIFRSDTLITIADSILQKVSGMDLTANIKLDPEAKMTLYIDPVSGDYVWVSGRANLNISIDPSGTQTITGAFEVTDGEYQISFYGLVKKSFGFVAGSTITFSGDPMSAQMDFTASYTVRTQSLALISNESAGLTDAEKNLFRQRLPYEVLLHINGQLEEPQVSFELRLPDKYMVNYPQIASKLNQINSGNNESELNKQVFALLVTGSFIADDPFASSGGSLENFASTAALNSVNGILAEQLNKLSSRYIKGVDITFGLNSYEDYEGSSSQTRTELDVQVSKRLFDDRLTIEASGSFDVSGESKQYTSESTQQSFGEFSATYDLTKSSEYKIRAYHENAYDLFDGEVAYDGIAFIIEKSFNSLFGRRADKNKKNSKKDKPNQEGVTNEE